LTGKGRGRAKEEKEEAEDVDKGNDKVVVDKKELRGCIICSVFFNRCRFFNRADTYAYIICAGFFSRTDNYNISVGVGSIKKPLLTVLVPVFL
jgi:hypothetical protein